MKLTAHAKKMWEKRFPELDPDIEWRQSARAGSSTRKCIRESCPVHAELASKEYKGCYYRRSVHGVVFVVRPPETVITVFSLRREP